MEQNQILAFSDLKMDMAYRVTSGDNGTLAAGDIIWVDSISKCLNSAAEKGWLEPEFCTDDILAGLTIEPALDYAVMTEKGRGTRCFPISLLHMWQ